MTTLHVSAPTPSLPAITPEQKIRLNQLTEEWGVLNGYVEDTQGEGGEHQQALADLESWNDEYSDELKGLEELEESALRKAHDILQGQTEVAP